MEDNNSKKYYISINVHQNEYDSVINLININGGENIQTYPLNNNWLTVCATFLNEDNSWNVLSRNENKLL